MSLSTTSHLQLNWLLKEPLNRGTRLSTGISLYLSPHAGSAWLSYESVSLDDDLSDEKMRRKGMFRPVIKIEMLVY